MKPLRLLLLAIPFMLLPAGGGMCEEDEVSGSCRTIAAILTDYPALAVRGSKESIRDLKGIPERPGCRIVASGPTAQIIGNIDPSEAARGRFQRDGWTEDIRYSADGPGTTSFAFRKNGILCRVRGGAHSWIEDGKSFTSERYELEAECISDPDGTFPGLPP